jgi:hypothetical protein
MPLLENLLLTSPAAEATDTVETPLKTTTADDEFGRLMDSAAPAEPQAQKTPKSKPEPLSLTDDHGKRKIFVDGFFPNNRPTKTDDEGEILLQQQHLGIHSKVELPPNKFGEVVSVDFISAPPTELAVDFTSPIFLTLPIVPPMTPPPPTQPAPGQTETASGSGPSGSTVSLVSIEPTGAIPTPLMAGTSVKPEKISLAGKVGFKVESPMTPTPRPTLSLDVSEHLGLNPDLIVLATEAKPSQLNSPASGEIKIPAAVPMVDGKIKSTEPRPTIQSLGAKPSAPVEAEIADALTGKPDLLPEDLKFQASNATASPTSAAETIAPQPGGTGVATDAGEMKKAEKGNNFAGSEVKVLPSGKAGRAHQEFAPVAELRTRDLSADQNFQSVSSGMNTPATAEGLVSVTLPTLGDTPLRTVERTHEMVAMHAVRLAKSDAESLSVVIRPGGGTELSLELRQRNGTVEVQAMLQNGDYQSLNQSWPELQQKLEQRGIKLAPLGGEANSFSSSGNENFSRQNSPREERAQQASAFAEFTVAMTRGGATARSAPASLGNEWWA